MFVFYIIFTLVGAEKAARGLSSILTLHGRRQDSSLFSGTSKSYFREKTRI